MNKPDMRRVEDELMRHDAQNWKEEILMADSEEKVMILVDQEHASVDAVRRAYYEATKVVCRNTLGACMATDLEFIRKTVNYYREKREEVK